MTDEVIKVADLVWLATALLHRASPTRADFRVGEIIEIAEREGLAPKARRATVRVHINQHCVGNLRRLFRPGDAAAPGRKGKMMPRRDEVPVRYHGLLDWYADEYCGRALPEFQDPLLALKGSGKSL